MRLVLLIQAIIQIAICVVHNDDVCQAEEEISARYLVVDSVFQLGVILRVG